MKKFLKLVVMALIGAVFSQATAATWTVSPMSSDATSIRTDGTSVLAYSVLGVNVNGVSFSRTIPVTSPDDKKVVASPKAEGSKFSDFGWEDKSNTDYGTMLSHASYWSAGSSVALTFNSLKVGNRYLVQLVAHNAGASDSTVSVEGSSAVPYSSSGSDTTYKYGASLVGTFTATAASETFTIAFVGSAQGVLNAIQLRDLTGSSGGEEPPTPTIVNPTLGSVSAAVNGTSATISLSDVALGTDDSGTAATSYSVSYKLNAAASVAALSNQTGSTASFTIDSLADGTYTCEVTVTTSAGKTASKTTDSFTVSTSSSGGESGGTSGGGSSGGSLGWSVSPMDASGAVISTDGDLVAAYSVLGGTVNGVSFTRTIPVTGPDDRKLTSSVSPSGSKFGDYGAEGTSGAYGQMLSHATYWNSPVSPVLTFSGLTVGHSYQVQIISHSASSSGVTISAGGTTPQHICTASGDETYKYGASIIGSFTAAATTQDVPVTFAGSGEATINAIQIRDITSLGPVVTNPSFDASASVIIKNATISLSNVQMGTDDEGAAATSYSVTCALNGGAAETKLTGQSGETASFTVQNLADGDYTAVITVTSDAGKTATKTVTFTIDTAPKPIAPTMGAVTARVFGTSVTVTVANITLGTNAEGTEAAESYSVSYTLAGKTVTALTGETAATAAFTIDNLEAGTYSCDVTVTTDKNRTVSGSCSFKIKGSALISGDPLKISEICPRPDDLDPNGKESGWIELWNSGTNSVNLSDYEIVRANRGKALAPKGKMLASKVLQPGEYAVVYMSEEYPNADSGLTVVYENDVMVCPRKISPKKFPLVALYKGSELLEEFIVPVDIPDNQSFAPAGGVFDEYAGTTGGTGLTDSLHIADASAVTRVILPTITKGAENNRTGEVAYGPNAGPLYGIKHDLSDWHAFPLAKVGQSYAVTLAINPLSDADGDEIASVRLVYRNDYNNPQVISGHTADIRSVDMVKGEFVEGEGQLWTAVIPASALPSAGYLLRWAAQVVDASGNLWRTPSFRNPDDGYEWYGTLVEPAASQLSETLPTWHFFCDDVFNDMNWQYDKLSSESRNRWPYGVRCGIYDSQTSNYYDNVRIDVRGNTTAEYPQMQKKSHGLRFSKVHPMQCTDPFSGEKITVRKTSVLAEYQDPSNLRSDLSMHLRRMAGQEVPFGYPLRLQLNGEFFQLAHHSNRFTDEYLTDYFDYDEQGCAFKNVGTVGGNKNTGGAVIQILPDDGTDVMAEHDAFKRALCGDNTQTVINNRCLIPGSTNAVVRLYDLPYWFNFLALSRLTQECDDDTSTLNLYYDRNGTGTWRPLAYDVHQSFGVFWADTDTKNRPGLLSTSDDKKCHPFHGGLHAPEDPGMGNRAYEGIYQTAKFRRLLVRRLRTLMDEILKEPGTSKENTPFWRDYVVPMYAAMKADNDIDRKKKSINVSCPLYVWPGSTPLTFEQAVDDMWDNYIVPRRNHFYVTHSITNTAKEVGYGTELNAGIPLAQSSVAALKAGFSVVTIEGGAVIRNLNAETVDMSGWTLTGPVDYTFPAGSVIDQAFGDTPGEVFIVTDRKAYVAALEASGVALTDQVILGNAQRGSLMDYGLESAAGEVVVAHEIVPPAENDGYNYYFSGDYTGIQTVAPTGTECRVVFENANIPDGFYIPGGVEAVFAPTNGTVNAIASITGGDNSKVKIHGEGTVSVAGADTLISVSNLVVKSGTLRVTSAGVTVDKTPVINVLGHVKQSGGTIDLDLSAVSGKQAYGIFLASKDPKNAAGKAMEEIYAEFGGGTFNAKVSGAKSSAVYVDKGSVVATFLEGETVNATLGGTEPRFISAAGNVKFNGGTFNVTGAATAEMGRVFKSDKKITINDGHFVVNVPGSGTEIFSTSDNGKGDESSIKIDGGTFELVSDDDCFNADHHITVNGGLVYAVSLSNDVFDSNGDMTINGGTILAYATAEGHEGLDVDPELTGDTGITHVLTVNGGTVFATGGSGAQWPATIAKGAGVEVAAQTNRGASQYSQKYLSLQGTAGVTYTAKLPSLAGSCAIFATCPGFSGTPTTSSTAPTSGSQDFHDFYIVSTVQTYQEQLRVYEVYGSTTGTGDEGEYIVVTNVSAQTVQLEGFKLTSAKDDGKSSPKVNLTLGEGTVAPYGSIKLTQADYTGKGWDKITNGKIVMVLATAAGVTVQTARSDFSLYPTTDGQGDSLVAKRFDGDLAATTDDWCASSSSGSEVPAPVIGGGSATPVSVSASGVTITISNAVKGHVYYYKQSDTIQGLAGAAKLPCPSVATEDGTLLIEFTRKLGETAQFYQVFAE